MLSRRKFLKYAGAAGAAAILPWKIAVQNAMAQYGVNSPQLQKFIHTMRGLPGQTLNPITIPIMTPDAAPAPVTGVQHYTINIRQFTDQLHPDLPNPTKLWGFGQGPVANFRHLGGIVVAQKGTPAQFTFINRLPRTHIIPLDRTITGANQGQNRAAIHLHGGFVPWISDGGPFDWWQPNGTHGLSFLNNQVLNPGAAPNMAEYYYPNAQTARLMWYHDHAHGITRINAYAGIATAYVLDDAAAEAALFPTTDLQALNLRDTYYLVFQDKIFIPQAGPPPNYPVTSAVPGDLFYAYIYDTLLFGPQGIPSFPPPATPRGPLPVPSVVPEFFGDTILVNGTAYPTLTVEARPYRFRMLNACNARFLRSRIVATRGATFPNNAEPNPAVPGPTFLQIGTEGGYLPQVTRRNGVLLAPAERADVLVDFTGLAGREFILFNNAPGPFPGGNPIFDYYPGNPSTPVSTPGSGPNTRTLLKIVVVPQTVTVTMPTVAALNAVLPALIDPPLVNQVPGVPTNAPLGVRTRQLTLNEGFDDYGRLGQFLGTNVPTTGPGFFGHEYLDPATEVTTAGTIEVWEIANLTLDAHPMHFHLVNVQILWRRPFNVALYNGTPTYTGPRVAPERNELGWKETVRMNPGEVTAVIMKFDLPRIVGPDGTTIINTTANPLTGQLAITNGMPPTSPRTGGNEYVWHCHILEHEEHDMMRPLIVA
jgi:spore coat protein A